MDPLKDYYAVLGVLPSIEPAAIRAVYLVLLKKYHPDVCKGGEDKATRRTEQINEAYNVLSDDKHREKYDLLRADFCKKYVVYKRQNHKKINHKHNIENYCHPREGFRPWQRINKSKSNKYGAPWRAKQYDSLYGTDRLRVFVVGIVMSVALAFIISAFAGSV